MEDIGLFLLECFDYIEAVTNVFSPTEELDDRWVDDLASYSI